MSIYYGTAFRNSPAKLNDGNKKIEFSFRRTSDLHPLQPRCRLRRVTAADIVDVYEFVQGSTNYRLTAGGDLVDGSTETLYLVNPYNGSQNLLHGSQSDTAKQGAVTLNSSNGWPVASPGTAFSYNYEKILPPMTQHTSFARMKCTGYFNNLCMFEKYSAGDSVWSCCSLGGEANYFFVLTNLGGYYSHSGNLRPLDAWFTAACVFNGDEVDPEDRIKLYINGVEQSLNGYVATIPASIPLLPIDLYFGNFQRNARTVGYYTDWLFYTKALTADEISSLHTAMAAAYAP